MRRLRDIVGAHCGDLGDDNNGHRLSEGQKALVRRASMMQLELEMLDSKFAKADGHASSKDLDLYSRTSGNLRRILESLGLHTGRKMRDVSTIDDDATYRAYQRELQRASP
jgi:hypothetical protein